jgi:hypothetical protein
MRVRAHRRGLRRALTLLSAIALLWSIAPALTASAGSAHSQERAATAAVAVSGVDLWAPHSEHRAARQQTHGQSTDVIGPYGERTAHLSAERPASPGPRPDRTDRFGSVNARAPPSEQRTA